MGKNNERIRTFGLAGGLLLGAAAAAAGLAYLGYIRIPGIAPPFARICLSLLEDRLISPSSMTVISMDEWFKPLSRDQFEAALKADDGYSPNAITFELSLFDDDIAAGKKPRAGMFMASIEIDSQNAMGTFIRSRHLCEEFSTSGELSFATAFTARLDGFTKTGWMAEQLRKYQ